MIRRHTCIISLGSGQAVGNHTGRGALGTAWCRSSVDEAHFLCPSGKMQMLPHCSEKSRTLACRCLAGQSSPMNKWPLFIKMQHTPSFNEKITVYLH